MKSGDFYRGTAEEYEQVAEMVDVLNLTCLANESAADVSPNAIFNALTVVLGKRIVVSSGLDRQKMLTLIAAVNRQLVSLTEAMAADPGIQAEAAARLQAARDCKCDRCVARRAAGDTSSTQH